MTAAVWRRAGTWALALAVIQGAAAAPATDAGGDDAAERARIAAERRVIEARFDTDRQDCEARFLVTDCLATARAQRRIALEPLQQQLHLLDDARRRARAAERLRLIQARESAAAARPALGASMPAPAASPPSARPAPRPVGRSASSAQQQAQARAARHAQRQQQARDHEAAVQARNARRDAQRPPAAGLPVPALPVAPAAPAGAP